MIAFSDYMVQRKLKQLRDYDSYYRHVAKGINGEIVIQPCGGMYNSLASAMAGEFLRSGGDCRKYKGDLVFHIKGDWPNPDTSPVWVGNGWKTTPTSYITIKGE